MWSGGSTANLRVECRLAREDLARGGVFAIAATIPSETIGDWSDVALPELEIMSCRRFNLDPRRFPQYAESGARVRAVEGLYPLRAECSSEDLARGVGEYEEDADGN